MTKLLKYFPGLSAAVLAYGTLKLMGFVGVVTGVLEFVLFVAVYLIFAIVVEQGMRTYGSGRE